MESALETLKKGKRAGGLEKNSSRVETINIEHPEKGHRTLAFALADILSLLGDRIREVAVDSACQ